MQLTPEDIAKLETKELANIIRKLNAGGTLTAAQRALLARARVTSPAAVQTPVAPIESGYAANWDELAKALDVSRKSVQNWRGRTDLQGKLPEPRADGRHDIAAWARAMVEHRLARADEDVADFPGGSVTDWRRRREQLQCEQLEREIAKTDEALLVAAKLEIATGQLLAGICAGLNALPGSASRFLVGLRDIHVIQERLEGEVAGVLTHLHAARYLEEDCVAAAAIAIGCPEEHREIVTALARAAFAHVGRLALAQIMHPAPTAPEEPVPESETAPATDPARPPQTPATSPAPIAKTSRPPSAPSKPRKRPSRGTPKRRRKPVLPAAATREQASDRPPATPKPAKRRRRR